MLLTIKIIFLFTALYQGVNTSNQYAKILTASGSALLNMVKYNSNIHINKDWNW